MTTPARERSSLPATTVLIDGNGADVSEVVRSVRQVSRTVPADVRIVVLVERPLRLERKLDQRVAVVRVSGSTGVEAALSSEVSGQRLVVRLPVLWSVAQDWLALVWARLRERPAVTSVVSIDGREFSASPPGMHPLTGPRSSSSTMPGVTPRRGAEARRTPGPRHQSFSAVLIVKDEEEVLGDCLRAVSSFVDEIVVYDTGSTDDTIALARSLGAKVIEGYWNDHFADARNRALEHASTDWVVIVDADEVAQGDPRALRRLIDTTTADGLTLTVVSTTWGKGEHGSEVGSLRIFRRGNLVYRGALHEEVVTTDGSPVQWRSCGSAMRLVHSGYTPAVMAAKDKGRRNLEIARSAIEARDTVGERDYKLVCNYARSLALAGHVDEALQELDSLLGRSAAPGTIVEAGRVAVLFHLRRGDLGEVDAWISELERAGESPGAVTVWRAKRTAAAGDQSAAHQAVQQLLLSGPAAWGQDVWGIPFPPDEASQLLAELDLSAGHSEAGLHRMLAVLDESPDTVDLELLFRALEATDGQLSWLVRRAPEHFLDRSLRVMAGVHPRTSLPWLTAFHEVHPGDHRPVAAGCVVAARTDWLTALTWSLRARELGLAHLCPLRRLAEDDRRPALDRCMAWSLLTEGFAQEDALAHLVHELEALAPEDVAPILTELSQHTPAVVELLTAVSTGPSQG